MEIEMEAIRVPSIEVHIVREERSVRLFPLYRNLGMGGLLGRRGFKGSRDTTVNFPKLFSQEF